jgi:hypothetical protein
LHQAHDEHQGRHHSLEQGEIRATYLRLDSRKGRLHLGHLDLGHAGSGAFALVRGALLGLLFDPFIEIRWLAMSTWNAP